MALQLAADALFWDREEGCVATFTHGHGSDG
jgi:hypothetical protein